MRLTLSLHSLLAATLTLLFGFSFQGPSTISGTVIDSVTSRPVANATVALDSLAAKQVPLDAGSNFQYLSSLLGVSSEPAYTVSTDGAGRFRFADVQPGSYNLNVTAPNYLDHVFGESGFGLGGRAITATSEGNETVTIRLTPASELHGRVTDRLDQPLEAIPVYLLRTAFTVDGERRLQVSAESRSMPDGSYSFGSLASGEYYVLAGNPFSAARETPPVRYMWTYSPHVADPTLATPINLPPAVHMGNIDLAVAPVESRQIEGVLADRRTGRPPIDATVVLELVHPVQQVIGRQALRGQFDPASGHFRFDSIPDGQYALSVILPAIPAAPGDDIPVRQNDFWMPISVNGSDINELSFAVPAMGSLRGRVLFSDGRSLAEADPPFEPVPTLRPGALPEPAGPRVALQPLTQFQPPGQSASLANMTDGAFTVRSLLAGRYRVTVQATPSGVYVDKIALNGAQQYSPMVDLSLDTSYVLEVWLASDGGAVQGVVTDDTDTPLPQAGGLLLPYPLPSDTIPFLTPFVTDANGAFSLDSIPPGEYQIFAWQRSTPGYPDPAMIRRNQRRTSRFTIASGEKRRLEPVVAAIPPQ
jgi:Carboxypeptidase regulatory-like domain